MYFMKSVRSQLRNCPTVRSIPRLDISYERLGKVQENASVESSLLSIVTQVCLMGYLQL